MLKHVHVVPPQGCHPITLLCIPSSEHRALRETPDGYLQNGVCESPGTFLSLSSHPPLNFTCACKGCRVNLYHNIFCPVSRLRGPGGYPSPPSRSVTTTTTTPSLASRLITALLPNTHKPATKSPSCSSLLLHSEGGKQDVLEASRYFLMPGVLTEPWTPTLPQLSFGEVPESHTKSPAEVFLPCHSPCALLAC